MEHTFGSWVEVSIYRNPASSPLSLSMRFDANRANSTRDFGRVSAAFRVSSNLNPCAVFWSHRGLGVGRWSAAGHGAELACNWTEVRIVVPSDREPTCQPPRVR